MAAICSGVASWPSNAEVTSPGTERMMKNTTMPTTSMVANTEPMRRTRYVVMRTPG